MTVLPPLVAVGATRDTLHRTAEDVLAARQFAAIGKLGLFVTPGGFGTRWFTDSSGENQRVRVEGLELVDERADSIEVHRGLIYPPVDPVAAAVLVAWWHLGDRVLEALTVPAGEALSLVTLWPEHFDIARTVTLATDSVNLGFSPGDGFCDQPYLYAGPWTVPAGDFWNAPFGAYRTYEQVLRSDDAEGYCAEFLAAALAQLRG
jgi:hypothetical protein